VVKVDVARGSVVRLCRRCIGRDDGAMPKHEKMWARRDVHLWSWKCGYNAVSTFSYY
jgi:hypothetical protein